MIQKEESKCRFFIKKKFFVVFEIVGRVFTTQRDTRTLQKDRAHTLFAIFGRCASGRGARILRVQVAILRSYNTKNPKNRRSKYDKYCIIRAPMLQKCCVFVV